MSLYLGADDYDAKIRVYFLKSFRMGHIWENLWEKGLKKRRAARVVHWCAAGSSARHPPPPASCMPIWRRPAHVASFSTCRGYIGDESAMSFSYFLSPPVAEVPSCPLTPIVKLVRTLCLVFPDQKWNQVVLMFYCSFCKRFH
jgi:hypothetical protein